MRERDSDLAERFWAAAGTRISSHLVYPEARAALAAATRAGRLTPTQLRDAVGDLEQAVETITLVGVDGTLSREAGQLAEIHRLRGYDAVHLATALAVDPTDFVMVTWDRDLAAATLAAGRAVAPAIS